MDKYEDPAEQEEYFEPDPDAIELFKVSHPELSGFGTGKKPSHLEELHELEMDRILHMLELEDSRHVTD